MSPSRVLEVIESLLPQIQKSASAEDILINYAKENNLAPEQLTKMAMTLNTARSVAWMDNNPDQRGASIPLIDTVKLASDYGTYKAPAAAKDKKPDTKPAEHRPIPRFMSGATGKKPLNNPAEKMAFATPAVKPPTPGEKAAALIAARRVTEINVARLGDLQEDQSALYRTAITKLAKYIGNNKSFFAQMEEDVSQLADAEGQMIFKAAVKQATASVSVQLTPWTKVATKRSLLHDRTNILPLIKTAADALQLHNAYALLATRETEEFAKLAGKTDRYVREPEDKENFDTKPAERTNSDAGAFGRQAAGTGMGDAPDADKPLTQANLDFASRLFPREYHSEQDRDHARIRSDKDPSPYEHIHQEAVDENAEKMLDSSLSKWQQDEEDKIPGGPDVNRSPTYTDVPTLDRMDGGKSEGTAKPTRDPRTSADTASKITKVLEEFIPKGKIMSTVGSMPGILDKMKATGDSKYAPKFRQKGIDHAVRDVSFVSNLQRLIMTDPILGEADPQHLVDLANDLQKGDPRIAHNPNQLRFALREALQYGGVPIQTHKTLADIDKSHSQAEQTRGEMEDRRYA